MNWKNIFHWEKQQFGHTGNSVRTAKFLALGKALLARLYLYQKVQYNFVWIFICFRIYMNLNLE